MRMDHDLPHDRATSRHQGIDSWHFLIAGACYLRTVRLPCRVH